MGKNFSSDNKQNHLFRYVEYCFEVPIDQDLLKLCQNLYVNLEVLLLPRDNAAQCRSKSERLVQMMKETLANRRCLFGGMIMHSEIDSLIY